MREENSTENHIHDLYKISSSDLYPWYFLIQLKIWLTLTTAGYSKRTSITMRRELTLTTSVDLPSNVVRRVYFATFLDKSVNLTFKNSKLLYF